MIETGQKANPPSTLAKKMYRSALLPFYNKRYSQMAGSGHATSADSSRAIMAAPPSSHPLKSQIRRRRAVENFPQYKDGSSGIRVGDFGGF
jgi:hypothetical protein